MKAYHIFITQGIGASKDIYGNTSGITADYIRSELSKAKTQGAEKLVLHMATFGGQVYQGLEIFNAIEASRLPVDVYIESMVASIGTLIMLAGTTNTIYMSPASQILTHPPSGQTEGTAEEHKNAVQNLEQVAELMAERYASKIAQVTGTPFDIENGRNLLNKGDYTLTPAMAKQIGLIDYIQMPVAAVAKTNLNDNTMKKKPSLIASLMAEIQEALSPSTVTAGAERLADGTTTLYFEGDTLETGKAVFTDEAMTTKAPEGEHALEDGRIAIVDVAGVVVEIREVEVGAADQTAELATANARIADLEAELATAKAENQTQATAHQTQIGGVTAKLAKLQAMVVSAGSGVEGEVTTTPKKESAFVAKTRERVEAAKNGKLKI